MSAREIFESRVGAGLLLLPTLLLSAVFLYYPTVRAIQLSFFQSSFGSREFAGLANYASLLGSAEYRSSVLITIVFAVLVVLGVMVFSLLVTFLIHEVEVGRSLYLISAIWPYALPPAVAGLVFLFLVHPNLGVVTTYVESLTGFTVDWFSNGRQAFVVVLVAVVWKQVGYNVIFMIASMSNIPASLTETAELDGVGRLGRLLWVYVPIMSPTLLFLVIMNTIYAFFHTFAFIRLMTQGGPAGATNILIFDLFRTAFKFYNFGMASAKSVVLFVVVGVLMLVQFRLTEEYAHYGG